MTAPRHELDTILAHLDAVLDGVQPLATEYAELLTRRTDAGRRAIRDDLGKLRPRIFAVLRENVDWVAGAGLVVAPGLLDGTQRWLEWWWTRPTGAPEALRVNLDESAADFFDYTSAEWYAVPAATGRRHAAGPFVDHLCTNQYSVTLTSPVHRAGELVGVVGADVLVSSLEAMVLPVLARIGSNAALVTADGRVIASIDPTLAPGYRVDVTAVPTQAAVSRRRTTVGGLSGWLVASLSPPG